MVSKRKIVLLVVITTMMFMLYACSAPAATQDPNAKITEIAATVQAELTRVYALTPSVTPTLTPTVTPTLSSETPTLTSTLLTPTATKSFSTLTSGDNSKYDDDITIPDGSLVLPGSTFEKTWSVLNNGTTTWTENYQIKYIDGTQTQTLSFKLTKDVAPGELAQITIKFVAPSTNGSYVSWWKLENADGYLFGDPLSIAFIVGTETLTPTTTAATPTNTPNTPTP